MPEDASSEADGKQTVMMEISDWGAVRGDEIVAKGGTKEQARRAATQLDEEYWEIIALPPSVGFI